MDDYLTLLGTLLGAVVGAVIAYLGAYQIERQHFARDLRERIYGPMFMETSKILEGIKSFQGFDAVPNRIGRLKGLMNDYLFSTIAEDMKLRFSNVIDRLGKYQKIQYAAILRLSEKSKNQVMEVSGGLNVRAINVNLNILIGETLVDALNLQTAVFLQIAPQDFVKKEKDRWGEGSQFEVTFAGVKASLDIFQSLFNSISSMMEGEPLYLQEKEQRTLLITELKSLLERIEPFVKPEGLISKLMRLIKDFNNRVRTNTKKKEN